jgi:hypothetical protein
MVRKILSVLYIISAFLGVFSGSVSAFAEGPSTAKVSGLLFGDYYWLAKNHIASSTDQTGFWIRRAYLTIDNDISDHFTSRLQLEMNQNDFNGLSTTVTPFIKNAYLKYSRSRHSVLLGISGTPTWSLVESHWGYRSIEKTPLDLYKFGNAVDGGISFLGHLDRQKRWGYHLMAGHGVGAKSENNKDKKYYLAMTNEPTDWLVLQIAGDYEENNNAGTFVRNQQFFIGLKQTEGRIGLLYAQNFEELTTGTTQKIEIASAYGVLNFEGDVSLIARMDMLFDHNPNASKITYLPMIDTARSNLYVVGADIKVSETVNIQPNVELVLYNGNNEKDLIPRVTVFYKF